MTDAEISKALALAIGWPESDIDASNSAVHVCFEVATLEYPPTWRLFDYKMPDIIWPIAERYDCFPSGISTGDYKAAEKEGHGICSRWECLRWHYEKNNGKAHGWVRYEADTAAKAVAIAVIGKHAPK